MADARKFSIDLDRAWQVVFPATKELLCPSYGAEAPSTGGACLDQFSSQDLIRRFFKSPPAGPLSASAAARLFAPVDPKLNEEINRILSPVSPDGILDDEDEMHLANEVQVTLDLELLRPFLRESGSRRAWENADSETAFALYRVCRILSGDNRHKIPPETEEKIRTALSGLRLKPLSQSPAAVRRWAGFKMDERHPASYRFLLPNLVSLWMGVPASVPSEGDDGHSLGFPEEDVNRIAVQTLKSSPQAVQTDFLVELYGALDSGHRGDLEEYLQSGEATPLLKAHLEGWEPEIHGSVKSQFELLAHAAGRGQEEALKQFARVFSDAEHPLFQHTPPGNLHETRYYSFGDSLGAKSPMALLLKLVSTDAEMECVPERFRQELRLFLPHLFRRPDTHAACALISFVHADRKLKAWQELEERYSERYREFRGEFCPKDGQACPTEFFAVPKHPVKKGLPEPDFKRLPVVLYDDYYKMEGPESQVHTALQKLAVYGEKTEALSRLEDITQSGTSYANEAFTALVNLIVARPESLVPPLPSEAPPAIRRHLVDYFNSRLDADALASHQNPYSFVRDTSRLLSDPALEKEYRYENAFGFLKAIAKREGYAAQSAIESLRQLAELERYGGEPVAAILFLLLTNAPEIGAAWEQFELISDAAWLNNHPVHSKNRDVLAQGLKLIAQAVPAGKYSLEAANSLLAIQDDRPENQTIRQSVETLELTALKSLLRPFSPPLSEFYENDEVYWTLGRLARRGNRKAFQALQAQAVSGGDLSVFRSLAKLVDDSAPESVRRGLTGMAAELASNFGAPSGEAYTLLVMIAEQGWEGGWDALLGVALSESRHRQKAVDQILSGKGSTLSQEQEAAIRRLDHELSLRGKTEATRRFNWTDDAKAARKPFPYGREQLDQALRRHIERQRPDEERFLNPDPMRSLEPYPFDDPPADPLGLDPEPVSEPQPPELVAIPSETIPVYNPAQLRLTILDPEIGFEERERALGTLVGLMRDPMYVLSAGLEMLALLNRDCVNYLESGRVNLDEKQLIRQAIALYVLTQLQARYFTGDFSHWRPLVDGILARHEAARPAAGGP